MKEIDLEEVDVWFSKQLSRRFKKEHKILGKLFKEAQKELSVATNSFKGWKNQKMRDTKEGEKPLDEKSQKIVQRFVDSMIEALSEVKIPTFHIPISYENCEVFSEGIKKVYIVYNQQGRKSIPRFGKKYSLEIKEVDLHLRKIGDLSAKVSKFLLKNYADGKVAESSIKTIPRLMHDIERLGFIKGKLDEMIIKHSDMEKSLADMEEALFQLSEDPLLMEFEKIEQEESRKSNKLRDSLKFQKAFKKLKKMLEKGKVIARDVSDNDIRPYMKSPVTSILDEGPQIPRLREVLIRTRILLEDEANPLQIKADLRKRIIENINKIVTNHSLEPQIISLLEIRERKKLSSEKLKEKGLEVKRDELKEKISTLTVDLEHFTNDLNRRQREYDETIERVVRDRNNLEETLKKETDTEIKIKIIIPA